MLKIKELSFYDVFENLNLGIFSVIRKEDYSLPQIEVTQDIIINGVQFKKGSVVFNYSGLKDLIIMRELLNLCLTSVGDHYDNKRIEKFGIELMHIDRILRVKGIQYHLINFGIYNFESQNNFECKFILKDVQTLPLVFKSSQIDKLTRGFELFTVSLNYLNDLKGTNRINPKITFEELYNSFFKGNLDSRDTISFLYFLFLTQNIAKTWTKQNLKRFLDMILWSS